MFTRYWYSYRGTYSFCYTPITKSKPNYPGVLIQWFKGKLGSLEKSRNGLSPPLTSAQQRIYICDNKQHSCLTKWTGGLTFLLAMRFRENISWSCVLASPVASASWPARRSLIFFFCSRTFFFFLSKRMC